MDVTLPKELIVNLLEKKLIEDKFIGRISTHYRAYDFNLEWVKPEGITAIINYLTDDYVDDQALRRVKLFQMAIDRADTGKIGTLESSKTVATKFIRKNCPNRWLFEDVNGVMVPWYVEHIRHVDGRGPDNPSYLELKLVQLLHNQYNRRQVNFYSADIVKKTFNEALTKRGALRRDYRTRR